MTDISKHNARPRILQVVQSLDTGGLENGIVNLANGIDTQRFKMDILCLRYVGELRDRLGPESDVFFDASTAASITNSILSVRRYCRRGQYNIVHTHGWATLLPGFLGARIAGKVRVINGEHGTFFVDTARRRLAQRALFRLVDANCTVSASLSDEMQRLFHLPGSLMLPIINGVDVKRFRSDPETRAETRKSLGVKANEILFGAVGRLVPVKDFKTLITAFRELSATSAEARLILVGDGPELAALRTVAGDLCKDKKVAFLGNRDDVPSLMNAMDVYCLTSLREGLSNTLLEAHACGLPVIATDTGGNGEVVVTGRTGFLFQVGDDAALTILMRNLAEHKQLRNSLSVAARERAAKKFSIARMVREYEKLYENVLH